MPFWQKNLHDSPENKALSKELMTDGVRVANELFFNQLLECASLAILNSKVAAALADDKWRFSLEVQFVWGVMRSYASDERFSSLPTSESQRATLMLIRYLIDYKGMEFDEARNEAQAIDHLWNSGDPLFEQLQEIGEGFFSDVSRCELKRAVEILAEERFS